MKHRARLKVVLLITILVMVGEVVAGLISGSLALLADAGHMLTDVAGISLALLAISLGSRPPSAARTFGWHRFEILAAAINAVLLFGVAIFVLVEAWKRFSDPPGIDTGIMLVAAVVGLAANGISARLLLEGQRE
ncbi:MAG: cation diffusion facilitator family transporter, partial [Actinomycetota bacterium]